MTATPTHAGASWREITPADVLRGAALYLGRHGWHQGAMFASFVNPTPAACLLGAIRMAACGGTEVDYTDVSAVLADQAVYELATLLRRRGLVGDDDEVVSAFNDHHAITKADAIVALEAAARQWDSTHGSTPARHTGGVS